jgi:uncharacterized protein YjbI with pentapeptide repeats
MNHVARLLLLVAAVVLFLLGFNLWWPPEAAATRGSDLGVTILGGLGVSLFVFYLSRQFSRLQEKRNLQLQLGSSKDFPGINLSGRDLSGFYLPGKNFSGAVFTEADLRRANLSGCDLLHAKLARADLRGAKLDETPLFPSEGLYPSEKVKPGIYPEADMNNVDLEDAVYDSSTRWPSNITPDERGAINVEEKSPWWGIKWGIRQFPRH